MKKEIEQAKIEALEAIKMETEAIKMEIEDIKMETEAINMETEAIKNGFWPSFLNRSPLQCQIEESFFRFPHICEQILEKLDYHSLLEFQKVSRPWQDFISEKKVLPIALLRMHTLIPKAILKKSLRKHDIKTVQNVANFVINQCNGMYSRVVQAKEIYHILFQKDLENIHNLLIELLLQNVMDTKVVDQGFPGGPGSSEGRQRGLRLGHCSRGRQGRSGDSRVQGGRGNLAGAIPFNAPEMQCWSWEITCSYLEFYLQEKKELFSWSNFLLAAVTNGNFSICKFIIETTKDVYQASAWGKTLIAIANSNGHHDVTRLLENSFQIEK